MALLQVAQISGAASVFGQTLASAIASGLISGGFLLTSTTFYTPAIHPTAFTRMAYDMLTDAVIVTNGRHQDPSYQYHPILGSGVSIAGIGRPPLSHVLLRADTLHPAGSAGTGGAIVADGASQQYFPASGGGTGFSFDVNTETTYQHFWFFATNASRGGGTALPYGYGYVCMISTTDIAGFGGWHHVIWDGAVQGEQLIASAMWPQAGGRAGILYYLPAFYWPPLPAVLLDDIAVFVHADWPGHSWISCRKRPVTTAANWRGTRGLPFGWPMSLSPMGTDRVIGVWWSIPQAGAPLVYAIFRYDRGIERLRLEDVGNVPSFATYYYPGHVGYASYDIRRGRLVFLSPNTSDIHTLVVENFCHPRVPRELGEPVPLDPYHAGYQQRFAALTNTAAKPLGAPRIAVSYPSFASTAFTRDPIQFATNAVDGIGTFAVIWGSAASGMTGTITVGFSSYSVTLSATYSGGVAYGTEGMTLLTSTAPFTVSTTLTATSAVTVTIMPRIPVSQADAVGAGSPRLLSYPTSALATPYYYNLNPQQTINFNANPLTRPLYASQRSLTKTVNAQFVGDVTDLEVTEIWMGGGNRIAMALSQFAMLYDFYYNVPDFASSGYIQWQPRDISNRTFKVLITSLTVGGSEGITLDNLVKAGTGYVHDTVEMRLRLIEEVA